MHTIFSKHIFTAKYEKNKQLHCDIGTYVPTFTHSLTCARSPSYLYSQVNAASSNFFMTSPTPLVGWANMGLSGTPVSLTGESKNWEKQGTKQPIQRSCIFHGLKAKCQVAQEKFSSFSTFLMPVQNEKLNNRGGACAKRPSGNRTEADLRYVLKKTRSCENSFHDTFPLDTSASHPQLFLFKRKKKTLEICCLYSHLALIWKFSD